jgi:hypothetical protein
MIAIVSATSKTKPGTRPRSGATDDPRQRFVEMLPQIRRQAWYAFRHLPRQFCQDLMEEVIADAYVAFARFLELGKVDLAYPTPLAQFSIRRIRSGRRVGQAINRHELMSPLAQRIHKVQVERLDRWNRNEGGWKEIVVEDRRASPAETAAARIDLSDWFLRLPRRERAIAKQLALGQRTQDVARRFQVSAGRISQLRQMLQASWQNFQGQALTEPRAAA